MHREGGRAIVICLFKSREVYLVKRIFKASETKFWQRRTKQSRCETKKRRIYRKQSGMINAMITWYDACYQHSNTMSWIISKDFECWLPQASDLCLHFFFFFLESLILSTVAVSLKMLSKCHWVESHSPKFHKDEVLSEQIKVLRFSVFPAVLCLGN